jgi:hypothetical protein
MNRRIRVLLLALLVGMLIPATALAVQPPPATWWGQLTIDGVPAADGTVINAVIEEKNYATCPTFTYEGQPGFYLCEVYGDDPDTVPVEGGQPGQTVTFKVDGITIAETVIWHSGVFKRLDLTGTAGASEQSLAIVNATGATETNVQIPVQMTGVSGLVGASFTVTYNPAVLSATDVLHGSLTGGWLLEPNLDTPGEMHIALTTVGEAPIGNGTLVLLEFQVTGAPGMTSDLSFKNVKLNDGAIIAKTDDGVFEVAAEASSHTITIKAQQASDTSGLEDAKATLSGSHSASCTTDSNGSCTLESVPSGNHTVVMTGPGKESASGIAHYDAALVLQHVVHRVSLDGYAAIAADVTGDGTIGTLDAREILRFNARLIDLPFENVGTIWKFSPPQQVFAPLDADQTATFFAILYGDVSQYMAMVIPQSTLQGVAPASQSAALQVLSRQDSDGMVTAHIIVIPGETPLHSVGATLTYAPDDVSDLTLYPAEESDVLVLHNLVEPGHIRISLASGKAITSQPTVLKVRYRAAEPVHFSLVETESDANDGEPLIQLADDALLFRIFLASLRQ